MHPLFLHGGLSSIVSYFVLVHVALTAVWLAPLYVSPLPTPTNFTSSQVHADNVQTVEEFLSSISDNNNHVGVTAANQNAIDFEHQMQNMQAAQQQPVTPVLAKIHELIHLADQIVNYAQLKSANLAAYILNQPLMPSSGVSLLNAAAGRQHNQAVLNQQQRHVLNFNADPFMINKQQQQQPQQHQHQQQQSQQAQVQQRNTNFYSSLIQHKKSDRPASSSTVLRTTHKQKQPQATPPSHTEEDESSSSVVESIASNFSASLRMKKHFLASTASKRKKRQKEDLPPTHSSSTSSSSSPLIQNTGYSPSLASEAMIINANFHDLQACC